MIAMESPSRLKSHATHADTLGLFNMPEIDLESAIDEIIYGCDAPSEGRPSGPPFFFIVGAGISVPVIPTAREIEHTCKEVAQKRKAFDEPNPSDPMKSYSYWFEKAFPHASQRTTHLRYLMDTKPISPANLRLAHLLQNGSIANIAVTSNFDDHLSRALRLFGASPILCDHPGTIRRLGGESSEVQILHVHGTYPFYDACNLDVEIKERAWIKTATDAPTVFSFLSHLLWKRSPIVIGYSGWERDVIMSALKERMHGQVVPLNLYWFCYEHSAIDMLPDWLRNHNQVRFVTPESKSQPVRYSSTDAPLERVSSAQLDAAYVLERFISKANVQSPQLFSNPVRSFAQMLQKEIYNPDDSRQDTYHLSHLLMQVTAAADWLESPEGYAKASPLDELVSTVLDANRRADLTGTLKAAANLVDREPTATQRHEIIDALMSSAVRLWDDPTRCISACDLVLRFTDGRDSCTPCEVALIHACFLKGEALRRLKRYKEAILEYDRCVEHASASHDVALCSVLADALYCKALAYFSLGNRDEEIAVYEDLWKRCINIPDRHLRQLLAKARTNVGMALQEQKRNSEALEAFRQVVQEFGKDEPIEISEPVAKSLVHIGLLLEAIDDNSGALKAYDEVIERFWKVEYENVYDPVAKALANKTLMLSHLNHTDQAIESATTFIDRFGDKPDRGLLRVVAAVHHARGQSLGKRGDHVKALEDFDWIIDRCSSSDDPEMPKEIALSWANRGVALRLLGQHDEALAAFDEVEKMVKNLGLEIVGDVAVLTAMKNKAASAEERQQPEAFLGAKRILVALLRGSSKLSTKIEVATAMYDIGFSLMTSRRFSEAVEAFEDLSRYSDGSENSTLMEHCAEGFYGRAQALGEFGQVDEKLGCYSELIRRFKSSDNLRVCEIVAGAIFSRGIVQRDSKDSNSDSLASFEEVVQYCIDRTPEPFLALRAKALFAQAQIYRNLAEFDLEFKRYDEIEAICEGHSSSAVLFQLARERYHRSLDYFDSNEYEKVITACSDIIGLLAPLLHDNECADLSAQCLLSKAHALKHMGRYEDALLELRKVAGCFTVTTVLSAKKRLAQTNICEALLHEQLKQWKDMRCVLENMISSHADANEHTNGDGAAIRKYVKEAQSLLDKLNMQSDLPEPNL